MLTDSSLVTFSLLPSNKRGGGGGGGGRDCPTQNKHTSEGSMFMLT